MSIFGNTFTSYAVISICKQIDSQTYDHNKVQEQCRGQTVFFQEKGAKGDKGDEAYLKTFRLNTAKSQIQKLKGKVFGGFIMM